MTPDAANVAEDDRDRMDWRDARLDVPEALLGARPVGGLPAHTGASRRISRTSRPRCGPGPSPPVTRICARRYASSATGGRPRATDLLVRQSAEIDGNAHEIPSQAMDALASGRPAATPAVRAMIGFTHRQGGRGAAATLATCATIAPRIEGFGAFEAPEAHVARLKKPHRLGPGFRSHVDGGARAQVRACHGRSVQAVRNP